jgi:HEXXH motif-containing protein
MDPFWDIAFGRAQRCVETQEIDIVDTLALIAFRLANFKVTGNCFAKMTKPFRFCWGDTLLPYMDEFQLNVEKSELRLEARLKGRRSFLLTRDNISGVKIKSALEPQKQLHSLFGITLLSADSILDDIIVEDEFHTIFSYPIITSTHVNQFSEALAVLERIPNYHSWVKRIIRGIVVCETNRSRTRSSSWSEAPGMVLVSLSKRPYLLAEMLVHEASHQYYNLISRLGDTVDKSDTELYFSPAVERPRHLNKILLGYHAFANFFLFYHYYREFSGQYYKEVKSLCAHLEEKLSGFEQALLAAKSLTPVGEALFWPLYNKTKQIRR